MYKFLLCWRYLRTRYLALACIISVMLGVATLIVVNSVMSGFSTKLKSRLHGLLSDVQIECYAQEGFGSPDEQIKYIMNSQVGTKIRAATPTLQTMGMVQLTLPDGTRMAPRPVKLIGVDAAGRNGIGGFGEYLVNERLRQNPTFELSPEAQRWHDRKFALPPQHVVKAPPNPNEPPAPDVPPLPEKNIRGVFLGYAIGNMRWRNPEDGQYTDMPFVKPGDEVMIYTLSGEKLVPVYDNVAVADFIKTEMSEQDGHVVFVPIDWLQELRTMQDRATHIQIKLKDYADAKEVVATLRTMFPKEMNFKVDTWEELQGPLLAAISVEKGILNLLLFLIIGVAGFGILAIFAMIVVEKTRDIGILKALGASNTGVMNIFLGYGLWLGLIGAVLGTVLGLAITIYINGIEKFLARLTGQEIFPRDVYYFDSIPTDIQTWTVVMVNVGAVAIAVVFSVLPALRAAFLHPVRALRYE